MQCDLRYFDMSVLGKFAVVMADPPWDIHMELPYGAATFPMCDFQQLIEWLVRFRHDERRRDAAVGRSNLAGPRLHLPVGDRAVSVRPSLSEQ